MAYQDCLDTIQQAAGRALTDDELDDLLTELTRRQKKIKAEGVIADSEAAILKAAEDYAADMAAAAAIEKRNTALNLKRRLEALDQVRTRFAGRPELGIEALDVGVNNPAAGARFSAAAEQNQLAGYYLGGFIADVEKSGHWQMFISGALDQDIARALWRMADTADDLADLARPAVDIAGVVHKWQEVARADANRAGAWIKKMPGYIARQSHDLYRIQRAGYEAWRDFVMPRLDLARTLDEGQDAEKFLRAVYHGLASGVHMKASTGTPGLKGPTNLAKRASAERVLHFKSADAWTEYNGRFGANSLREAVLFGLERSARSTGLMRVWGPNAEANRARVIDELLAGIKDDPEAKRKFAEDRRWLDNRFEELDGSTRIPGNAMGAQVSSVTRAVQSMAKLGGAVLSAVTDIPLYASEMRYQGRGMLEGMGDAIGGLTQGKGSRARREILAQLGVFFDAMRGDVTSRFSAHDDLPGKMSRLMQTFFKWNGLTWWTDTLRGAAALSMSHRLAMSKGAAWDALDADLRRTLSLYGIDGGKWDIVRAGAAKMADGREYLTPEAVRDLPDEMFAGYLTARELKPTPARIRDLKAEIESQFRAYYVDRTSYAVIEPDQRTTAIMRRGTKPGTVEGEFLRFVGQFKAFPVSVITKTLGREVYGRGANSLRDALRNGNGEMVGLAQLMVWTTLFGYGAMTAKDLLKGRTPRDPSDPRTWGAAMVQGGGMGIYGDFLFGELRTRFGGGPIATALGPVAGTAEDILDIVGRLKAGDETAAPTFRAVVNNTPFLNLFYTRIALDYLFLYQIQESLNPGYLKRMEARIEKENGQTFLARPSQAIPTGGGSRLLEGVR